MLRGGNELGRGLGEDLNLVVRPLPREGDYYVTFARLLVLNCKPQPNVLGSPYPFYLFSSIRSWGLS